MQIAAMTINISGRLKPTQNSILNQIYERNSILILTQLNIL